MNLLNWIVAKTADKWLTALFGQLDLSAQKQFWKFAKYNNAVMKGSIGSSTLLRKNSIFLLQLYWRVDWDSQSFGWRISNCNWRIYEYNNEFADLFTAVSYVMCTGECLPHCTISPWGPAMTMPRRPWRPESHGGQRAMEAARLFGFSPLSPLSEAEENFL